MIKLTDVQRAVLAHFTVTMAELVGLNRGQNLVTARHIAWYLERERSQRSYEAIGVLYSRHHTAVMTGVNHMKERLAAGDARYVEHVETLLLILKQNAENAVARELAPSMEDHHCPTCGVSVIELQRQIANIHRRLTKLGVKP